MYNEVMENTDFVIEHIDEEVKVITDRPSSVVNYPANTDFFIENIDDNVISIAHSLNIEASEVEFRPANTDFFIENIDNNVIMIAESLELIPSEVTIRPANTDFFVENIDKNLIAIAEYYDLEPSRVVLRPANTDMFIDNIDRNVTLIKSRTNVITKSGSFINVDVPDGGTMQLTAIDGNATQTTYSGKNLADYLNTAYGTQGAIVTHNPNNVVITKTATGEYRYVTLPTTADNVNKMLGKSVTLTFKKTSSIAGHRSGIRVFWVSPTFSTGDNIASAYDTTNGSKSVSFNIPATIPNSSYPIIGMLMYPDMDEADPSSSSVMTISDLQLEVGTATDYEPYVGGIPSPNPDYPQEIQTVTGENVVKVVGKNICPISEIQNVGWATANTDFKNFLNSLPLGTYSISVTFTLTERNDTTDDSICGFVFQNAGGQIGSISGNTWGNAGIGETKTITNTFTINEAKQGNFSNTLFYGCGNNSVGRTGYANVSNIQLEHGSTVTSYQAFTEQDYAISLGELELAKIGDYQDRIYKDDGKWYIEKQVGKVEVAISYMVDAHGLKGGVVAPANKKSGASGALCDKATFVVSPTSATVFDGSFYENPANFVFLGSASDDLTSLRTKFNGATLYYALATPTTTEITDETLLEQLNFVADMYEGINNISFIGTGTQGTIEVVINKN